MTELPTQSDDYLTPHGGGVKAGRGPGRGRKGVKAGRGRKGVKAGRGRGPK